MGQAERSAEEEEQSDVEEERDAHLDEEEREKRLAVMRSQAGYAVVLERRKRPDEVIRGDDKQARIDKEVPEVTTSASDPEKQTIRQAVAFRKQPAKADPCGITTSKTRKAHNVPRKEVAALDTGNYNVLGSSQLDNTVLGSQERETGELTLRLLLKAKTVSVPKDKRVAARTLATPKRIAIALVSAFSGRKDHAECAELRNTRASHTVPGKIHGHELPMLIDGGSDICLMSEQVARSLNIGCKHAN